MSLRVSGGRRLQSPPGRRARPTAARVRLAVINRLAPRLGGCRWLDLCCGSGAMACEALQHGAAAVVGVEQDRRIAAVARANLEAVAGGREMGVSVQVVCANAVRWLDSPLAPEMEPRPGFDLIYVDPPYAEARTSGLYQAIADGVRRGGWLAADGLMVWECAHNLIPEPPNGWLLTDQRRYGGSAVLFLELVRSAAQGTAAAVLIPGSNEQPSQSDGNQAENNAAEERFDHGSGPGRDAPRNSSMMEARPRVFPAQP